MPSSFRSVLTRSLLGAVAATLVGSPSTVFAQARASTNALGKILPRQLPQLRLHDGHLIDGHVAHLDASLISFSARPEPASLSVGIPDSVWVRHRSTRSGAIIGGIVAGAAAFSYFSAFCFGSPGCLASGPGNTTTAKWRAVGTMTVVSAGGGVALGAAMGSLRSTWLRVEAPRPRAN